MLITNVSEEDQCEIPAVPEPVLAALLCVSASLMWKVKLAVLEEARILSAAVMSKITRIMVSDKT